MLLLVLLILILRPLHLTSWIWWISQLFGLLHRQSSSRFVVEHVTRRADHLASLRWHIFHDPQSQSQSLSSGIGFRYYLVYPRKRRNLSSHKHFQWIPMVGLALEFLLEIIIFSGKDGFGKSDATSAQKRSKNRKINSTFTDSMKFSAHWLLASRVRPVQLSASEFELQCAVSTCSRKNGLDFWSKRDQLWSHHGHSSITAFFFCGASWNPQFDKRYASISFSKWLQNQDCSFHARQRR